MAGNFTEIDEEFTCENCGKHRINNNDYTGGRNTNSSTCYIWFIECSGIVSATSRNTGSRMAHIICVG